MSQKISTNIPKLPEPPPGKSGWPWTERSEPLPACMLGGTPWPKISVVTPSFNQGQFIEETIRSVLLQGYPNLEYIIIDGGSTDNTLNVIKKYEPWLTYWESQSDRGQGHAINKGIKKSTGEILFWLNSDDIVLPNAFDLVAQKFTVNPDLKLIIGQARVIDSQSKVIGEVNSKFLSWKEVVTNPQNSIRQISSFFSRELFEKYGYIDESLYLIMDTDLMIRFSKDNTPLVLDDYLTSFRSHAEAKSYKDIILAYEESDCVRKKYIQNKELAATHKKRSAGNWINLSGRRDLTLSERFTCMRHAIHHQPKQILSRSFLSTLKNLCIDVLKFTLPFRKKDDESLFIEDKKEN